MIEEDDFIGAKLSCSLFHKSHIMSKCLWPDSKMSQPLLEKVEDSLLNTSNLGIYELSLLDMEEKAINRRNVSWFFLTNCPFLVPA